MEKEVEVVETVEVVKTVEVEAPMEKELGPWTIQAEITEEGMYLIPEEVEPRQWVFKAASPDESCYARTYTDLSTEIDVIESVYEKHKGFFQVSEDARMIVLKGAAECEFYRIGEE